MAEKVYVDGEIRDETAQEKAQRLALFTIPLETVKASLKQSVDATAEIERAKYITGGSGQAMTYIQKSAEATQYLGATTPAASDYPLLSAEVGITAATLSGVAEIVNQAYLQWQQIGAAIEATRLGAKAAIEAALTEDAANEVYTAIVWPAPPAA